jgi:hypothetical protein
MQMENGVRRGELARWRAVDLELELHSTAACWAVGMAYRASLVGLL